MDALRFQEVMPPDTKHDTLKVVTTTAVSTTSAIVSTASARRLEKSPLSLPWLVYGLHPAIDDRTIAKLEKLPASAKATELSERANTFASSGRNVFVHYVESILNCRRNALHSSGLTKKKYLKSAAQLWQTMKEKQHEEYIFWCKQAVDLQVDLRSKSLSHEDCLKYAGRAGEAGVCIRHAQIAVGHYLDISLPPELERKPSAEGLGEALIRGHDHAVHGKDEDIGLLTISLQNVHLATNSNKTKARVSCGTPELVADASPHDLDQIPPAEVCDGEVLLASTGCDDGSVHQSAANLDLLDTLPKRFECTPNMRYSHFAHYDFDEVRHAEGRRQAAMLRQLADLLDKTGKELFYYFIVPRSRQSIPPPRNGSTVMSLAGDVWRFLPGPMKVQWMAGSQAVKKAAW